MKKKWLLATLSVCMLTSATGCVEVIELDKEQQDKFVQYSVYSVLQHDKNYLVKLENANDNYLTVPDSQKPVPELPTVKPDDDGNSSVEKPTPEKPSGGGTSTSVTVDNLAEAFELEGVTLKYNGFKVCGSYPETDGIPSFVIKAVQGKKLVVLKFDMVNTSGKDLKLDISSKDMSVKGIFNNSVRTNALVTLLPEALNTYIGTIPAGGQIDAVLVFEMSDGYIQNLSEITLDVKSEKGSKSIKLQ